jgi:two-component system, OmpR family, phosphate regulon sensor histidine kinase PhoR
MTVSPQYDNPEHYRLIFEATPHAIVFADSERRMVNINPAFERLFGYTIEELRGKSTALLYISQEDYEEQGRRRFNQTVGDQHQPYEVQLRKKDGTIFLSQATGTAVRNAEGQIVGFIGIIQDITDQKEAEKKALEATKQMERMAILSKFVTDVSHDFRTPLSTIGTSIYFLERLLPVESAQKHINKIKDQVYTIDRIIQQLLTLTRLDSGIAFNFQPVRIRDLLEEVIAKQKKYLEECDHTLTLDMQNPDTIVMCDENETFIMLDNLLQNAIHYTPEGGKLIIRTYRQNDVLCIEFMDTGIGISEEDINHIFERFYVANSARTAGSSGSGLGLAIVMAVVRGHHGKIEVESKLGEGSIFRVMLPQAKTIA